MKQAFIPIILLPLLFLVGCYATTGGGTYRRNIDPVTGTESIQTFGVAFLTVGQGIFDGKESGFGLGGKLIDGEPYLIFGYNADNWLFMERARFRFEESKKVFTVNFDSPNREVGYAGRIHENQILEASSGQVGNLLDEIKRRSKRTAPSKLFVRVEGQHYFISAVANLQTGPDSFGGFFLNEQKN